MNRHWNSIIWRKYKTLEIQYVQKSSCSDEWLKLKWKYKIKKKHIWNSVWLNLNDVSWQEKNEMVWRMVFLRWVFSLFHFIQIHICMNLIRYLALFDELCFGIKFRSDFITQTFLSALSLDPCLHLITKKKSMQILLEFVSMNVSIKRNSV